jgi:hypothetical protein
MWPSLSIGPQRVGQAQGWPAGAVGGDAIALRRVQPLSTVPRYLQEEPAEPPPRGGPGPQRQGDLLDVVLAAKLGANSPPSSAAVFQFPVAHPVVQQDGQGMWHATVVAP